MSTLLSKGIYDAREVARLLAVDVEQVVRWATPDAVKNPPIAVPAEGRIFTFQELVSFALALQLRQREVTDVQVRRGLQVLRVEFSVANPLAHKQIVENVATSGRSLIAKLEGGWFDIGNGVQGTFENIVGLYLVPLTFDTSCVVSAWSPEPLVVLDPRVQAGAPCVAGTRIPTATLQALLKVDSVEDVADEYGLTPEQVKAAASFEQRLNEGSGLAA